ncbi:MAG TPA: hypothetical protein HPP50_05030 [Rhodospirillaceae bacterium]|jgi:hypothetical protein|nr:hypothetical protein [Rhodospirillaceae bacterium]
MITLALAESEGFTEMPPAAVTLTLISLHFSKSSDTAFAQSESDSRKDMICLRQASRAASPPGSSARSWTTFFASLDEPNLSPNIRQMARQGRLMDGEVAGQL